MIASNRTRTGDPFITSIKKIAVFLRFIYTGVAEGVSTLQPAIKKHPSEEGQRGDYIITPECYYLVLSLRQSSSSTSLR